MLNKHGERRPNLEESPQIPHRVRLPQVLDVQDEGTDQA